MEIKDRRVRRTREQLLNGLTKLMQEKSVNKISVRELTDLVDLNRGTFYLHYRDIYDMLEQIENEMFAEFTHAVEKHPPSEPLPMLVDIFHFIAKYADMCRVLLGKNGDAAFVEKLKNIVKEHSLKSWVQLFGDAKSDRFEYFYAFVNAGCIGLMQSWLENQMGEPPEEMAYLAKEIILSGVEVIR